MRLGTFVAGITMAAVCAWACSMSYSRRLWAKLPGSKSLLFAFERNGRVGFIDRHGNIVIPPTLQVPIEEVGDFSDGLARVNGKGYIDQNGRLAIQQKPRWEEDFADGLAWVNLESGSQSILLDRTGSPLLTWLDSRVRAFSEGLAAFETPGKPGIRRLESRNFFYRDFPGPKGFLNRQGQVVIEPTFAEVGPFRDGLAVAVLDGYCHIATANGVRQGSPTSGYPGSCGGAPEDAVTPCRAGFIDPTGRFAIEARFESAQDFSEKLAAVRIDGLWGFIDAKGEIAIPPRFQEVKPFSEGLAAVKLAGKWGFIDKSGRIAIPPTFQDVDPFSDSRALAHHGKGAFYIDRHGKTVIPGPFKEATPFVNGLAAVLLSDTQVAYIDHAGKTVFQYSRRRTR